ncbi:MAG: hypothetical protein HZA17_12850 [Nitrospirae bacterium]|nr:hypothetical protein [Nitrospirota bacterium]
MRHKAASLMIAALMLLGSHAMSWAFSSGSTGADGAFNPASSIEVVLPADGKLNYTTVNIPTGVTVTFKRNDANTPVYMLATGDVTIAGTLSVNGTDGSGAVSGKGGPGGFDGGLGGAFNVLGGKGLGPGGGNTGNFSTNPTPSYAYSSGGGGGGYGFAGTNGGGHSTYAPGGIAGGTYGNSRVLPVMGGSGGAGGPGSPVTGFVHTGGAGGGGGGVVVIASSGTITVTGSITANGGRGANSSGTHGGQGGGGSGGAIKLMSDRITGEGAITATGGTGGSSGSSYVGGTGGNGRIRFEANTVTRTAATNPSSTWSYPGTVFLTNPPTLSITSVGGVNVPSNPSGKFGTVDVPLPSSTTNPVTVNISAANIPVGTQVTITSVPEYGAATTVVSAGLSGTNESSTSTVSLTLSTSYQCILTAQATFTIQTAMYFNNEQIEKVRVATAMGRGSEVTYITASGREISPAELMAKMGN